jgi:hypothetical protein
MLVPIAATDPRVWTVCFERQEASEECQKYAGEARQRPVESSYVTLIVRTSAVVVGGGRTREHHEVIKSGTIWSKNKEDATRGEGVGGVRFGWLWLAPRVISSHIRVGLGSNRTNRTSSPAPQRVDPSENTFSICREAYCMALIRIETRSRRGEITRWRLAIVVVGLWIVKSADVSPGRRHRAELGIV